MMKSPELRKELAEERRELKQAVAELRSEIDEKTQRGKKLVSVVASAAIVARLLLTLKKRRDY